MESATLIPLIRKRYREGSGKGSGKAIGKGSGKGSGKGIGINTFDKGGFPTLHISQNALVSKQPKVVMMLAVKTMLAVYVIYSSLTYLIFK